MIKMTMSFLPLLLLTSVLSGHNIGIRMVSAERLVITLEPADEYHEEIGFDALDRILLRVASPNTTTTTTTGNECEEVRCGEDFGNAPGVCDYICGATIPSVDFKFYDGIQFQLLAPEGKEIELYADVNEEGISQMTIEFTAKADCGETAVGYVDSEGYPMLLNIHGSDKRFLVDRYEPSDSFVSLGKCKNGCTECEIATRIQLNGNEVFGGTVSNISWSMSFNGSTDFAFLGASDYAFSTEGGPAFITSAYENAIVNATPTPAPTASPTAKPTVPANNTTDDTSGGEAGFPGMKTAASTLIATCLLALLC